MSRRHRGQTVLGADFMSETKMVLDLGSSGFYFTFDPSVMFKFIRFKPGPSLLQTMSISSKCSRLYSHNLVWSQQEQLGQLVRQQPDVLTEQLGLTHLTDYET